MFNPKRRTLLKLGTGLAATLALPALAKSNGKGGQLPSLANDLSRSNFAAYIGQEFSAQNSGSPLTTLRLVALDGELPNGSIDCFQVLFSGDPTLPSGTYQLTHPNAGSFQLYLDPSRSQPGYLAAPCALLRP